MAFFGGDSEEIKKLKKQLTSQDLIITNLQAEKQKLSSQLEDTISTSQRNASQLAKETERALESESQLSKLRNENVQLSLRLANFETVLHDSKEREKVSIKNARQLESQIDLTNSCSAEEERRRSEADQKKIRSLESDVSRLEAQLRSQQDQVSNGAFGNVRRGRNVDPATKLIALENELMSLRSENQRLGKLVSANPSCSSKSSDPSSSPIKSNPDHQGALTNGFAFASPVRSIRAGGARRPRSSSVNGSEEPRLIRLTSEVTELKSMLSESQKESNEARTKLEKAERNLLKVENEKLASVIGLERSIQSLKDEVERLGDDLRWKEEMVSELKVELKNSESQSRRAREEVEEMRKIKADLERKVEEGVVSRSSSKPDPRSKELEEKCFGLETEIERLQQEVLRRRGDHREEGAEEEEEDREGSIRERIGQLETIIDQLEKELENKDEEMARVKKELEIVQSERLEIQERLEDEEKRGKEGGGGDGREGRFDREEALEREVDELVRERETFKGKYRDLKREFEIYRDEVQATRVRNEREPKPEVGKSEKEEGNREDRTAEIQSLRSRLSNLEMELFAAVEENEQLGSEREALVEELERSKERLERLRDSFRIREKELDELQTIAEKVAHQLEISEDKVDALEKQDRVKTLEIQALKAKEGAGQDVVQETFESLRQEILKRDSEHSELVEVLRRRERELKAGRKLLRNLSSSLFSYTPLKGGVLIGNGGGGDDSNSSKVEEEEDHQVLEESSFTSFSFNSLSGGGEDRSIQLERGFEEDLLDEVEQVKLSWEVARTRVEFCRVEEGLKLQRAEQDVKQNLVKIRQLEKILNQSETRGGEGGEDERDSLARELELAREEIERLRLVEKESEKMKAQLEELGDRLDRAERRSESIARLAESLESKRRRLESIESNRSRLETIEADARQREENLERFRELNQLHLSEVATWMVQAKETIQALNLANSRVAELHAQLHQVTTLGDSEEEGGSASVDDDVAELERARSKAAQATVRVEELEVQLASCKREVEEISEVKLGLELEIRELSSVVQSVETGMVEKESILQGLKETVERLESQLEEAQTREAIRDRELESARRDRADFESRLMLEIEEKARRVVEEEESFKAKQRQSDEHLDQIRKQLEIEVKEVSRLTEELSSMTSRKEQACQEVVVLRDKVEDLERREIKIREDSRRQAAELAEKTSELEARVLRRTEQIGQHQRDLESIRLEMDKVKMNQTLAEENCIELNEEKDELEQKVVGLEAQLQKVKAELESAREGKSSSEGTSAEQEDLERYRSEAVKLGGELERCRAELIEVEQSMLKVQEESRVKVDSLLEDLERAEADKVSLEGRISSSQQRVEDLDTIVERGRQEMERIEHQLCSERESQEKALENLKEKLVHVEVELERALTKVEEEARERSRLEVELASSRQEAETHREAAIEAQQAVAHHALALSDSVENAEVLRTKVVQLEQIEQERVKLREMLDQKALLMEELEIKVSQASAKENETILKLRAEKEESQAEVEKLSEKVRELEVWLSEVEEAAKSKEESRFASESRILELEALKEEDEVKVKRMKDQVESLDLQLSQARESLKVTQELVEQLRLDSSTKVSSCELEKARSELKQLEEEHSSALDRIGQLESVKESMEKEISDLRRQSRDSPNSEPLSGEQALLSKVQQLEVERDQIREESDRIVRESREEKEVMESEMTRSRDEMHKVERELETLRSQHDQMLTEMADSRNLASTSEERLRQVLSDSQAELDGLKSQLDSISSEKEATESKLDFRIQELTSLAEQVESDHAKAVEESSIKNREVMEKLESQLEGSSKAVEELEARLISLEAERDEALRRYQGLVDQIDEKDEQGRIKIQEVQARLEEAKSSSADQLELLKAKITEKDERLTSLEDVLQEREGQMRERNEEYWSLKEELAELQEQAEVTVEAKRNATELEEKLRASEEVVQRMSQRSQLVEIMQDQVEKLEVQLSELGQRFEAQGHQVQGLKEEADRSENSVRNYRESLERAHSDIRALEKKCNAQSEDLKRAESKVNELREIEGQLRAELENLKSTSSSDEAHSESDDEVTYLKSRIEEFEHELTAKADEIEAADTKILAGLKDNKKLASRNKALQSKLEQLQAQLEQAQVQIDTFKAQAETGRQAPTKAEVRAVSPSKLREAITSSSAMGVSTFTGVFSGRKRSSPEAGGDHDGANGGAPAPSSSSSPSSSTSPETPYESARAIYVAPTPSRSNHQGFTPVRRSGKGSSTATNARSLVNRSLYEVPSIPSSSTTTTMGSNPDPQAAQGTGPSERNDGMASASHPQRVGTTLASPPSSSSGGQFEVGGERRVISSMKRSTSNPSEMISSRLSPNKVPEASAFTFTANPVMTAAAAVSSTNRAASVVVASGEPFKPRTLSPSQSFKVSSSPKRRKERDFSAPEMMTTTTTTTTIHGGQRGMHHQHQVGQLPPPTASGNSGALLSDKTNRTGTANPSTNATTTTPSLVKPPPTLGGGHQPPHRERDLGGGGDGMTADAKIKLGLGGAVNEGKKASSFLAQLSRFKKENYNQLGSNLEP